MNDSRADPPSAPEAGRQIADHRRVAARLAAGTHHPPHQRMPEMRAWRRASRVCLDGDLPGKTYAPAQRAARGGVRRTSDAAFYSAKNEAAARAQGVKRVCIPNRSTKSPERKREQRKRWFRNGQKWRTG